MKKQIGTLLAALLVAASLASCQSGQLEPPDTSGAVTTAPATKPQPRPDPEGEQTVGDYVYTVKDGLATLKKYTGEGGDLVIPAELDGFPVAGFADLLFSYDERLTSVVIPGTVKDTGFYTFYGCPNLTSVKLERGVEAVGLASFDACEALASVDLGSASLIQRGAFQGCTALKSISLPENVTVEMKAFANSGLESVVVPAGAKMASSSFFQCEQLRKVEWYADGVVNNDMFAFCYALTDVTFGEGVTLLYPEVLFRCTSLEKLVLPAGLKEVWHLCLFGCTSLKELYILEPSLSVFHNYAGRFLPALTDVYFAGTEEQWNAINWTDGNEMLREATIHFSYVAE